MRQLIQTSRLRFWHYLVGPWVVGVAAASPEPAAFASWVFWAGIAYWALPANLLVYGVNDIADGDTDQYNPKKQTYETQVQSASVRSLVFIIMALNAPVGIALAFTQQWQLLIVWALWLACSLGYSLQPIRAKARPFLDGLLNALYYLPGIAGYLWAGGTTIDLSVVVALQAWVMAMHAYSAIPDITADTKAGLATTATALGVQGCLIYCTGLWALAAILLYPYIGWLSVVGAALYGSFCALNFTRTHGQYSIVAQQRVFALYQYFPTLNFLFGMVLFWYFYYPICILILQRWQVL